MKRRAEIKFETEETILFRQGPAAVREYCPECRAIVDMLSPRAMAIFGKVSERVVFRLIETGDLHYVENTGVFVCLNSFTSFEGELKQ